MRGPARLRGSTLWAGCASRRAPVAFDVAFDGGELSNLHRPVKEWVDPEVEEPFEPSWPEGLVAANDESRALRSQLLKVEAPQTLGVGRGSRLARVEDAATQVAQAAQPKEAL